MPRIPSGSRSAATCAPARPSTTAPASLLGSAQPAHHSGPVGLAARPCPGRRLISNYGALTLLETVEGLRKVLDGLPLKPVIIQISSDPALQSIDIPGRRTGSAHPSTQPLLCSPAGVSFWAIANEALAPVGGLFQTREARGVNASKLVARWGACVARDDADLTRGQEDEPQYVYSTHVRSRAPGSARLADGRAHARRDRQAARPVRLQRHRAAASVPGPVTAWWWTGRETLALDPASGLRASTNSVLPPQKKAPAHFHARGQSADGAQGGTRPPGGARAVVRRRAP